MTEGGSSFDLRQHAIQIDAPQAIALVREGWSREDAAAACAMDRQTLRDWVHRYNDLGLAGVADRPRRNGPRPRLSQDQQAAVTR